MAKAFKISRHTMSIPQLVEDMPCGDFPGDKVVLCDQQVENAKILFEALLDKMYALREKQDKIVIALYGGSGVGKSGMASLLTHYLNHNGIKSYALSGDNYPRRIPKYNDAERLSVFRKSGLRGLIEAGQYTSERFKILQELQEKGEDSASSHIEEYPWLKDYIQGGRCGLEGYLGTSKEQDFKELEDILISFKHGKKEIYLKRFGRKETELWYEAIDFSETEVIILEWTHANSDYFKGVDIPILLHSTPQETLEHRRARNRGDEIDSPFITMVLEIEQALLNSQAHKAQIILSKGGQLLTHEELAKIMGENQGE